MIQEILNLKERVTRIEETMATKDDIRQIYGVLDEIRGIVMKNHQELLFINQRFKRDEAQLDDHEGRIQTLEAHTGLASA